MRIDLRSIDERKQHGLMTDIVSVPSQSTAPMKRAKHDTTRAILDALEVADYPLSRLEICRAIGRKKSPHLINLIEELVILGLLRRSVAVAINGADSYVYSLQEW